jgi:hypothetical protein
VVPKTSQNGAPMTKIEPVAKPWAHFVAGGYEPWTGPVAQPCT